MAAAESQFRLMVPEDDGVPLREHLEGLIERSIKSGKPPKHRAEWEAELAGEPFPPELIYLWKIHQRLRRRQGNGFGLSPVSWPAIDAFARFYRLNLPPWEVQIIEDLDDLFLKVLSDRKKTAS